MFPSASPLIGNPILDEIDQKHRELSPAAQQAIHLSGVAANHGLSPAPPAGAPPASEPAPVAPVRPLAAPAGIRGLPAPQVEPAITKLMSERDRLNAPPLQGPLAHTAADTGQSGIGQIHNPFLRGLARVGDVIGSTFLPGAMVNIPGTSLHHEQLVRHNASALTTAEAQAKTRADTAEQEAASRLKRDQAYDLENPAPDTDQFGNPIQTDAGFVVPKKGTPTAVPLTVGGKQAVPPPKESASKADLHEMHAAAVRDAMKRGVNPDDDPQVQTLVRSISALQRQAVEKEPNRDDKAIAIWAKPPGERSPDDVKFLDAYKQWVKETKTEPGVARMTVLMNGRPVQILDPSNPENVVYTTAGNAIKTGAPGPASIPFQAEKKVEQAFTSGTYSQQLNAIDTARYHMETFKRLAAALGNGDTRALNVVSQAWKEQFGSSAPTNFALAKEAFAAEVGRAFSVVNVTQEERNAVAAAIHRAESPTQLLDAANTADELLGGKQKALKRTYEAGKSGHPNFGQQGVPKPGDVMDGYRFKGGDPGKPENWEKARGGAR